MTYIDGFVIAVPTANKQKFIDHANLDAVAQQVREAFAAAGYTEPHLFTVIPANGATRTC